MGDFDFVRNCAVDDDGVETCFDDPWQAPMAPAARGQEPVSALPTIVERPAVAAPAAPADPERAASFFDFWADKREDDAPADDAPEEPSVVRETEYVVGDMLTGMMPAPLTRYALRTPMDIGWGSPKNCPHKGQEVLCHSQNLLQPREALAARAVAKLNSDILMLGKSSFAVGAAAAGTALTVEGATAGLCEAAMAETAVGGLGGEPSISVPEAAPAEGGAIPEATPSEGPGAEVSAPAETATAELNPVPAEVAPTTEPPSGVAGMVAEAEDYAAYECSVPPEEAAPQVSPAGPEGEAQAAGAGAQGPITDTAVQADEGADLAGHDSSSAMVEGDGSASESYETCREPITPLGRGSTANGIGRWLPSNLREDLAVEQSMQDPAEGKPAAGPLGDPRWPASDGWQKQQQTIDPGGREGPVTVHYNYNPSTGEVDDFKIVQRKPYVPPQDPPVPPGGP